MYKHKVFAVAVNILPIHQSIYTVYALAPTSLSATMYCSSYGTDITMHA